MKKAEEIIGNNKERGQESEITEIGLTEEKKEGQKENEKRDERKTKEEKEAVYGK